MAPHIMMGGTATARLALIAAFVAVSAILALGAGLVWLAARRDRSR